VWHTRGVLRSVAVVALPGVAPFELGVLCEVFGVDRTDQGVPAVDFRVVTPDPGPVPSSSVFSIDVPLGLEAAEDADLVAMPAWAGSDACGVDGSSAGPGTDPRVLDLLRRAHERGAWVLSVCTGAFVLGEAGLLDGRRCTTHWRHSDRLARSYPGAVLDADVLYVQDGRVVTSAGTAAGIDACLHVVREEHGAAVAGTIARRMVVPPHRDGGQAQYIHQPVPACADEGFAPVVAWALEHLEEDLPVSRLARRAQMSERTFARRFRAATGASPAAWVNAQRLDRARELLEGSDLPVEQVARRSGFGSAAVLREHFARIGTSPTAYRRTFAGGSRTPAAVPTQTG
jgi:transcriptional regulator GlxA family with amidase domain